MTNLNDGGGLMFQALEYAKRGWPVIPLHNPSNDGKCSCGNKECTSIAKHPRTKQGCKDATFQPMTICGWWQRWPNANIAIKTGKESGLIVVDVDPRHGGEQSWQEFAE